MKQLIMNILNRLPENLNWGSTTARETVADAIIDGIESNELLRTMDIDTNNIESVDIPIKKTAEGWYDKLEVSAE